MSNSTARHMLIADTVRAAAHKVSPRQTWTVVCSDRSETCEIVFACIGRDPAVRFRRREASAGCVRLMRFVYDAHGNVAGARLPQETD